MTDATTQSALSLLERLRTLAETWPHTDPPTLVNLSTFVDRLGIVVQEPEWHRATLALVGVDYYTAESMAEAKSQLGEAIEALKGMTT